MNLAPSATAEPPLLRLMGLGKTAATPEKVLAAALGSS